MRRFSGAGGFLYALGERLSFHDIPLEDCGDGWDWRAPEDMSHWLSDSPIELRAYIYGEWISFHPAEIFYETGRVGFPRNLTGATVLASGSCFPITRIAEAKSWEMHQEASVMDEGGPEQPTRIVGMDAILHRIDEIPIGEVLVRLPSGGDGMFVGVGESNKIGSDIHINFNKEGVRYVRR